MQHRDFLGNTLHVGQRVVFSQSVGRHSELRHGEVTFLPAKGDKYPNNFILCRSDKTKKVCQKTSNDIIAI